MSYEDNSSASDVLLERPSTLSAHISADIEAHNETLDSATSSPTDELQDTANVRHRRDRGSHREGHRDRRERGDRGSREEREERRRRHEHRRAREDAGDPSSYPSSASASETAPGSSLSPSYSSSGARTRTGNSAGVAGVRAGSAAGATGDKYTQARNTAATSAAALSTSFSTAASTFASSFTSTITSVSTAAAATPLPSPEAWRSLTVTLGVLAVLCGAVSCVWWLLALAQCVSGGGIDALFSAAHPLSYPFTLLAFVRGGAMLAQLQGRVDNDKKDKVDGKVDNVEEDDDDDVSLAMALPLGLEKLPSLYILLPLVGAVFGIAPVWAILAAIQLANLHKYFTAEAATSSLHADKHNEEAVAENLSKVVNAVADGLGIASGDDAEGKTGIISNKDTQEVVRNAVVVGKGVSHFLTDTSVRGTTIRNLSVFCMMLALLLRADYSYYSRSIPSTPFLFILLHYVTTILAISLHVMIDISQTAYRSMKSRSENPSGFFFPMVSGIYRMFVGLSQAHIIVQVITIVVITISMSITGIVFMCIALVVQKVFAVIGFINSGVLPSW